MGQCQQCWRRAVVVLEVAPSAAEGEVNQFLALLASFGRSERGRHSSRPISTSNSWAWVKPGLGRAKNWQWLVCDSQWTLESQSRPHCHLWCACARSGMPRFILWAWMSVVPGAILSHGQGIVPVSSNDWSRHSLGRCNPAQISPAIC